MIKLWLDDKRPAPPGYYLVEDYDQAIEKLQEIKSLMELGEDFFVFQMDHDLEDKHYKAWLKEHVDREKDFWEPSEEDMKLLISNLDLEIEPDENDLSLSEQYAKEYQGKTGYDVINYMEEHNIWPRIVVVHSHNTYGSNRMVQVASKYTKALYRRYDSSERKYI